MKLNTARRLCRAILPALAGALLLFGTPANASVLTLNSYVYPVNTGTINATLDGTPVIAICFDFFQMTPVPSSPINGTIHTVDYSGGGGGPLSALNNLVAVATFQMLIENYSYLPGLSNPIAPVDGDGIVAGQHVVWKAGSSPGLVPNPATAFGSFVGDADSFYNAAVAYFSNPANAAAYAGSPFANHVTWFGPADKTNQRFLIYTPNVPEPSTYAMTALGAVLVWRFRRRHSKDAKDV
jgi:hypothetical protein